MPGTDEELIRSLAGGETAALPELYDRHVQIIYGTMLYLLKDTDASEHIVQEVFVQLAGRASEYEAESGPVKYWLLGMAHESLLKLVRSRRTAKNHVGASIEASTLNVH